MRKNASIGFNIPLFCASLTALTIIKERYAKGEINKEEFEAKKKDLE